MNTDKAIKVDFTGVQSTMLVTLYLKALESRSEHSILGDHIAAELVERIDYDFDKLLPRGVSAAGGALRPRQFDEWAADFLDRHPDATVLHLGCGLDSRAFRMDVPEGVQWYDVDLPDVIELRGQLYSEHAGYRMIASSVTEESWLNQVSNGAADRPTLILAEGLLMYLPEAEVERLLRRLTDRFESGELIFDGLAPWEVALTQRVSKSMAKRGFPAYSTASRDGRQAERWNPRLRYLEEVPLMSRFALMPSRRQRVAYRLANTIPALRNMVRMFRYEF